MTFKIKISLFEVNISLFIYNYCKYQTLFLEAILKHILFKYLI